MRFNKRLFIRRNVLLQRDRLVLGRGRVVPQRRLNRLGGQVEPTRNQRNLYRGIVDLVADQVAGGTRVIVDQQPAFAIEQPATRRQHRHLANPVLLGQRPIVISIEHLQAPQAKHQNPQNRDHYILCCVQLRRRELLLPLPRLGTRQLQTRIWSRGHYK